MPAYGYEFYLLVVNSISHSFAALTREIASWPLEDKIHIHARACNILYVSGEIIFGRCEIFVITFLWSTWQSKLIRALCYHKLLFKELIRIV